MLRWIRCLMIGLVGASGLLMITSLRSRAVQATPPPERVLLPVLHNIGDRQAGVEATLEIQNVGTMPVVAVMKLWAEPSGFCEPQASGPFKTECTGVIAPGSSWFRSINQLPPTAWSATVEAWTACPSSDGAPTDVPLAIQVLRNGPSPRTPGARITASYAAIPMSRTGVQDPNAGGFTYHVPLAYAGWRGFNSWIYLQNGGEACTSVELWFQQLDSCGRAQIAQVPSLAPGESYAFAASSAVGPNFQGSVWIRASQPLGIVVDQIGPDLLMSYTAQPGEIRTSFDGDPQFSAGSRVAYGPLMYRESQGWDTLVVVQNLSGTTKAKVKVSFLDAGGNYLTSLVDWVCPDGSQRFFLPALDQLPGAYVGAIRVESEDYIEPGAGLVLAPNIVAIAQVMKYADPGRMQPLEAIAYNLLPEWAAFDWPDGRRQEWNVGLIAIPSFFKQKDGVTSEIAIQNVVPVPGITNFAIYLYDQNGLLDVVCETLSALQAEYINVDNWQFVSPGLKGSAVISATNWSHPLFDRNGQVTRNVVGLAAVVVERFGTRLAVDPVGDSSAGSEAIPIQDGFHFLGPEAPRCPGT